MRSDIRRISNYWTDILVVIEPRVYTPETRVRVVWKLRGDVDEWPHYGQVLDIGVPYRDHLVPL